MIREPEDRPDTIDTLQKGDDFFWVRIRKRLYPRSRFKGPGFFIANARFQEAAIKGIVIAGTKSGCGKTTVALGLMASLAQRRLKVAPFKVGPDFIDPGHHSRITGVTSRNLDGWMLAKPYNLQSLKSQSRLADIAVVEGVMGLFDGYDGRTEAGSTAQMAKWMGLPVILVVDARSMARSVAALVQGFERFDTDLTFAGVIFNNLGSPRHLAYLKEALEGNVEMPCLGGIIHDQSITIPERHLGLVTREDHALSRQNIETLAELIEKSIDVAALLDRLPEVTFPDDASRPPNLAPERSVRIGVAMDRAFCFYYQDNLDMMQACGAELVYFSPVEDTDLPENLDGVYLGGGYPELYARQLADNSGLRKGVKERSAEGMPIYGECGGFMYLCKEICDLDGNIYPMTGCFPLATRMFPRLKSLGYREITLTGDTVIGRQGQTIRGHEFHYSGIIDRPEIRNIKTAYCVTGRSGHHSLPEGYQEARTLGSYIHLHFGSRPEAVTHFIEACTRYRDERITRP